MYGEFGKSSARGYATAPALAHLPRARLYMQSPTIGCGRLVKGHPTCGGQFGYIPVYQADLPPTQESGIAIHHGFAQYKDRSGLLRWQLTIHATRDHENRPRRTRQEDWSNQPYVLFRDAGGTTHRIAPEDPSAHPRKSATPDSVYGSRRVGLGAEHPFRLSSDHFVPADKLPVLATCPACGQLNIIEWEVLMVRHSKTAS